MVNVFTGSPPPGTRAPWWDRLTGAQDPVARMRERRAEDKRALKLVGRDSVHLDLLDAQYPGPKPSSAWLSAQLVALLEADSVVHAPAGLGRHPDHEFVRDTALEFVRAGWAVVLYADLPHGIRRGWPAWVAGVSSGPEIDVAPDWDGVLAQAGLIVERLIPRVRPLGSRARARKLRALAEYRTQRTALDRLAFAPLKDPRALAFEVAWIVPPSALGAAPEPRSELLIAEAVGEPLDDRR